MSKFTKALEKIQQDKQKKEELKEQRVSKVKVKSVEIQTAREDQNIRWDRGITEVRNTKPDTRIVTYHFPNCLLAEQYRMLRTNLKNQLTEREAKVILVSSAIHGEGKTVTATNLALVLAEMENTKVALVDADIRRGKVGEYLGFGDQLPGLSNFLSDGLSVKQAMVRNSIDNLTVVPRGEIMNNPSELVSSQKFRLLIAELRGHFDYIIVDSPPIMSVADAGILGRETDGLLMVIQSGRTPKSVISHAHLLFQQAGVKLLGYVMTNVEFQSTDYRYYYHYYSDYDQNSLDDRTTWKGRLSFFLKKVGFDVERRERQFNEWWEKKVLKNNHKNSHKTSHSILKKADAITERDLTAAAKSEPGAKN